MSKNKDLSKSHLDGSERSKVVFVSLENILL